MKTLLYANRAEPKSISVISILLLAAAVDITKLRCMHRECYIFASQNLWYIYEYTTPRIKLIIYIYIYMYITYLITDKISLIFLLCNVLINSNY